MHALNGCLLALLAITLSQIGSALSLTLVGSLGIAMTAWLRLVISAVVILTVLRWRKIAITLTGEMLILAVSVAGMALLFIKSLTFIPLPAATALQFIGPCVLSFITAAKALEYLFSLFALAGMALVTLDLAAIPLAWQGTCCALLSGGCWALYIIVSKKAGKRHDGFNCLSMAIVWASCGMTPFMMSHFSLPSLGELLMALLAACCLPLLPYFLEMSALRRIDTYTFSLITSLEPCVSVAISFLLLGHHSTRMQLFGTGLIVIACGSASFFAHHSERRRHRPPVR